MLCDFVGREFDTLDGEGRQVELVVVAEVVELLFLADECAGGARAESVEVVENEFPARFLRAKKGESGAVCREFDGGAGSLRPHPSVSVLWRDPRSESPRGASRFDTAVGVDAEVDDRRTRVEFVALDAEFTGEVERLVDQFDGHPIDAIHAGRLRVFR